MDFFNNEPATAEEYAAYVQNSELAQVYAFNNRYEDVN
jgi:hypothetical protein